MSLRITCLAALLGLLAFPSSIRADQDPAAEAIVLSAEGQVVLERPGDDPREIEIGALLRPGDRVVPVGESGVQLLHSDGSWSRVEDPLEIVPPGGLTVPAFVRLRELILRFTDRAPVPPPSPQEDTPYPLGPANDIPVRVLTPTLAWRSTPGVEQYRVMLWDAAGELRTLEVEGSTTVLPPEWALTPGEAYEWAISPLPVGETGSRVRFRVLDREGLDRVAEEMYLLRESGLDPESHGALPALAVFQDLDLVYDALAVLDALLSREGPDVVPALRSLRSHLLRTVHPVPLAASPPESGSVPAVPTLP